MIVYLFLVKPTEGLTYGWGFQLINSCMGQVIVWPRSPGATRERCAARAGETPGKVTSADGASALTLSRIQQSDKGLQLSVWPGLGERAADVQWWWMSLVSGDRGSVSVYKRRRVDGASPLKEALIQTSRHRKQTLMSKLSDSGFEEDLGPSPVSSPDRTNVSSSPPLYEPEAPAEQLSSWYLQYGDIGYSIQREREAHFHPCNSLARQPQVSYYSNV